MQILENINCPEDVKKLSIIEMEKLSAEVREKICTVISTNGGHLAPSLGVVELTIALHHVFNLPSDKIVWDVGHQCYTHKILTGRKDSFDTIRTEGGLSGFPKISENEADSFGTGHASTAISAALGLAVARDLRGVNEKIIAVVGDGSMTGGLSFEGLNNAGASKRDMMVVLNDNRMAISPNVGALPKYLTDVISAQRYNKLKKDLWDLTEYIPAVGRPARVILNRLERTIKNMIVPGSWFENLGFRYFGPVDGHDLRRLIQIFNQIKDIKGPILLHVYTTKGKGYCFAEQDAVRFHGTSAFEQSTGRSLEKSHKLTYSKVFGDTLMEIASVNPKVCAITAAMSDSTGLKNFAQEYPGRFFDVGIAEGHAVTFAAGLCAGGMKPFVTVYSSFMQRSYDNIIHDVAIQKLPVVLCLDRAGFVGEDGPTHHGVFDLSFMRSVPDMTVMAPMDENELKDMLYFAADFDKGPVSIRYPRGSGTADAINNEPRPIEIGKAAILKEGSDGWILAIGEMVSPSLFAAETLEKEGINVSVVNMRFVAPLDSSLLETIAVSGKPVFTVEENIISGGFGSAVSEYFISKAQTINITVIGIPMEFTVQATRKRLLEIYGLTPESIAEKIKKGLGR